MRLNSILLGAFFGLLTSCNIGNNCAHLETDDFTDLSSNTEIFLNSARVGKVDKIILNKKGKAIVRLEIFDQLKIPKDSKFQVKTLSIMGTKGIDILYGKSDNYIEISDTLSLKIERENYKVDTLTSQILKLIQSASNSDKDSFVEELKKLNGKLEKQSNK